jgi:hypothetical protein
MGAEDLDEGDLKGGYFSMKKNTSKIELYLKSHIDVRTVDSWRPPEREPAVGNLV